MYRILMFVFAIGFFSCSTEDMEPQFKTVDNIDVTMAGKNMVNITADIHFYNPNVVGCTVEKVNLTAFAEGNEVSTIESNSKQEVPAKSEFVIPIKSSVALNKLVEQDNVLGFIAAALKKEVELKFEGTVTVSKGGINFEVPVEAEEVVSIK